ncbi:hypothetical protein TNCV_4197151 [Trichonephila clavipes]|nr:hypothetical protein TNCV_4197151 [Trichonephila clavipes]
MSASSSSVNPTPLAHANNQGEGHPHTKWLIQNKKCKIEDPKNHARPFSPVKSPHTFAETKRSHMELSRDCKGVGDHRGVALDQEVGNDEGCMAGGIVMVELDRVFNVSRHARDPAFQSPEHLQIKG